MKENSLLLFYFYHETTKINFAILMNAAHHTEPLNPLHISHAEDFRNIYLAYYPRLAYFAENIVHNKEEAEDIASAALAAYWEKTRLSQTGEVDNIQSWLFTAVRNACYNYLKHQRVVNKHEDNLARGMGSTEEIIEANLIEEDIINKLLLEIRQLPPKCAQVAELIYIKGYSPGETADILGISPSTVRTQQGRAVELIRASFIKKKLFIDPALILFFLYSLDK